MNKIYKVIWSKVRCAWVVVSEIARNHGAKGRSVHEGRKGASLLAGALLLGLLTGNGTVWAGTTINEYGMFTKGLTIGDESNVTQGYLTSYSPANFWGSVTFNSDVTFAKGFSFSDLVVNGMHIDYNNASHSFSLGSTYHRNNTSNHAISLGEAYDSGDYSFVAGNQAQAGKYSVVIGSSANGNNPYTVVLGPNTQAASSSIVLGNNAKTYSNNGIAIGAAAVDDSGKVTTSGALAGDPFSIAIGTGSATNQGGNGNIAIGYMAQNTAGSDAIVLGAFSKSDWHLNAGQQGYAPWEGSNTGNVDNSNFKNSLASAVWKSTQGGLSIGDITGDKSTWITRQISGVAAGTQDTDAVNVAQLKASMTILSSADGTVKITPKYNDDGSRTFDLSASGGSGSGSGGHFVSVTKNNASDSDDSLKSAGNYKNDGAAGTQSTAVGVNAQAQTQGTALGNGANASNTGATAIGTGSVANGTSSVALGQDASAQNDNAVAIGHGSGAYANSVAIGGNARSTAERSVHIGAMTDTTTTSGSASVSIGADAKATASGAASLGTGAVASGTNALALGQNSSSTGNGSVAIGYQTKVTSNKEHATAVGTSAEANATEGTVLGYSAKVNGDKGVALGSGAFVAAENGNKTSVALGAGSQVNDGDTVGTASLSIKDTYGETSDSTTYQFAGTNPTGTVSIGSGSGSSEQTRTITHVAAGRVSSTSTDAINGSQLYGVAQSIEKVEQNVAKTATRYYSVNATDTGTGSNYLNDGAHGLNSIAAGNKAQAYGVGSLAIGYSSLAGSASNDDTLFSSMAIGPYAKAQGTGAIAFGNSSSSSGYGGVALGGGANVSSYGGVALGGTSSATATGGVALGTGSQANTAAGLAGYLSGSKKAEQADSVWTSTIGAVSLGGGKFKVGSEEKIYTRQITNLAAGTKDTDAVNVAQLKAVEQEGLSLTGNDNQKVTQSLGGNFNITGGLTGDALKDEAASTANLGVRKNANGNGLEVVMTTTPSFDSVTAKNSITIKNASTADGTSDISLNGNGLFMGSKKITGLADGTEKTDAVNFSQLSVVSSELSTFENKAIQVGGNAGGTISRKLGENPILIQGAGTKDNADYSGTNLKTYVDKNGVLQILLDKELLEDRIDVGSALANPTDSRVNYPVVLGTDTNDATIGYVGINGKNGTSAVITSYAGSPIPGSAFNYTDSEGKSRMTRLEYTDQEGHAHHLATLTDGLSFGGDNSQVQIDSDSDTVSGTNVISRKLRATEPGKNATANYLQIKGGADAAKLSDKNIGVQASSEDGSLTIKLSQELTGLTSAQFGTTTIDGSGLTLGTTGISLTASGLNNGGKKITNVKAGEISSTSTDAIIGSQLTNILNADGSAKGISFGAESAAGSHTNPTSVAIGGTVTLKGAGGDSSHKNLSTQVTEKGELTVTMAPEIQENKIYVGTQIPKENSPTGKVNYPIILGENTVGTDTYGYVGIKGKNNSQLYLTADQDASGSTRLDYLDTQNNAHLVALTSDGYTFAGDTGTANTLALNSTLSITGGIDQTENLTPGNIGVVSSGNGGLTVQLAKSLKGLTDATFNSGSAQTKIDASGVTAPAYQVGTKTYIDSDGLHANDQKVTGVKAGTLDADSTDAVNGSQLFATNQNVTKNAGDITALTTRLDGAGMTFAGDSGTPVTKKLNETLTLTGGETSVDSLTQLSDKNIGLVADTDGKLEVRLAKDLTGLTGAAFSNGNFTTQLTGNGLTITPTSSGNAVNLTAQNLDLGGRQLHGVQAGEVSATSTDAVNGSQLHTVKETAENAQKEAQKHSTVSGSENVDVAHSDNTDGSKNYTVSLKDTVTLGTNGTAITLDGTKGNASFGSGTTAVTVDGTTGAITGSSLLVSGNVQAGSVAVGNIHLNSTADAAHNIAADTITGLSNTSYTSTTQLVDSRAATEGELGDVIASIQNGSIVKGLLTTVKEGSNISVVADDKSDPSKTQYTIGLSPVLTGLTRAEFTNGKTGTEAQTAVLSSDGLSLGSEDTSAQFTRTKVSAGNQQIQHVASGLNGQVYADAGDNNAATVGDLKVQSQTLMDTGITFAGNTGKETLALGKTAKIQGADLAAGTTLTEDYTTANLTTVTAKAADGTVTTTIYGKKDMAGRSLSLGTQDAAGVIANPVAVLKAQAVSSTDTTQTGHLVLKGTKPADTVTAADQTSADIYVQDGSDELQPADSKKMTRVMYADESAGTHELATLEDGLKFKGDDGNTSAVLLNGTLDVTGGADTGKLTTGNIGVTSDGKQGLTIALAKELKDLTSVAVTGEKFTTTLTGEGLTIAPAAGNSGVDSLVINASTGINLGNRKVTGLAAGTIGADSTDAVNGSQLHTVQEAANQAQAEAKKHSTVSVGDNNLVLTTTAENETKGADYALKLNNKITLGTGDSQVVLDGSDTGISSFGKQITLHGATGAVGVTSLTASGAVSASSVTVGDIILHSAADSTANPNVMKDTITGLGNTTYDDKNIVSNRAATEGQLQSLVSQINAGQISAGSTVVAGSSNISISSSKDDTGKITTYTASLTPELTGLTSAVFTNGKTGQEEETNTLTANGLTLGTDDGAARFTRSGISAGGQQVTKVGSGLQKVTDTSYLYDDTVAGQENYNHAANIGDVRTMLSDARDVFAGNNGTTATLTLGKTAAFQGADVVLTGSQTLEEALAADYSKANLTAWTVGNSDGSVTTSLYMKQDMVGRSLNLGNIGTDGTVADPAARLYTQAASDTDSTLTGHLKLTGIKEAQDGQTSSASADIYVKNALGSDLTDKNRAVTRLMYRDGVDQRDHTVATLDDGFYVQGDANQGNTLNLPLTSTLKIQGNTTAGSGLTAGNIGVVSDGKDTLKVQLADTLKGLKQISFADSAVGLGQEGINAGGKAISGVLAGTAETDAVNVKQLDEAKAAASAEVKAGKNVTVSKDTASAKDGHTIYTVAADFQGADVSGSNAVVYDSEAKTQVTLGGSTSATPVKLTNLADGTISSTSTDAVTGRQLNEVITYRNQAINVAGDRGSAVKLNHGNTLTISGDSNISTSSSGSDMAKDGSLQVSLADNVYVKGIHIGSTYPTHSDTSVDSVALTADAENQTGILTLRGDATHVSDTYPRAQADISVLSAAPDQTYMAAPFLQEVYQTNGSGTITKNQPVRLAYRDNYNTAHQIATLDDGYVFSGDNGDKNLTEKLNGTVALRGMDNTHASQITSDTANTYLTKNNIGVVTKPKVLNEDGSTQGGEVEIRLAKDLTGLSSATFTNDNGDTAVLSSTALTLTPENAAQKPVSLTNQGLDNGNNRITNVAAGTSDTDAVNYGQIKSIINAGDGKIKGLTFAAGDNTSATVHLGDTLKIAGATDQDGAQNIHTTVKDGTMTLQLDRKVQVDELHVGQKGSDAASLTAVKLEGEAGSIGQLHLQGMGNAQANIMTKMGTASLASIDAATTRLTYNNGNVGNTHEIAILEDGLRFTGDNYAAASGDKAEQNVLKKQLNQTLSITGGQTDTQQLTALTDKNIGVVAENGGLSVRLSKVLDGMTDIYMGDSRENASHLTKTGLYLSPKSSTEYLAKFTADDGISAGSQTISDVADGVKDSDAATYGQLKNVEAKANNATKLTVNHNQAEGNLTLTDTLDADGIHHTYDVALSDKIKLGSGGAGSSITLDGNANTINGGSYVQFGGDGDSKTSPLAIGWQSASLQDVITKEAKGSQTGNYLTGLSNTSWDPVNVGYSPNRAATEGQLRDLEKQVWENPITFLGNHDADKTAEESKGITAQLGSKVRIVGTGIGDGDTFDGSNLSVVAGKTSDGQEDALIIQMKKAPSFEAVHVGAPNNQGVYPVNVDGTGLRITNGPSITSSGIMAGDQRITSLASGGGKDAEGKPIYDLDKYGQNAANIQDVRNIANDAVNTAVGSFTIGGGKNIDVVHPQGTNQYTVALKDHVALGTDERGVDLDGTKGTIQAGSSTSGVRIDGNAGTIRAGESLTLDGNNGTLSGLTNTTITTPDFATKGRAATEEQLKQVADNVSEIKKNNSDFQLVGEKDQEGNYAGDYKVSDDNQVKLHVQDKMHPDQVKDITIDNVAKASDLGDVSKISEDIQNKENNNVVDALNNLNQKVKDAANGSWESQINGETVKKVKAGDVQNFTSGDNIELSNDNGAIKIATKKDVSFDKVTIGSGDSKMTLDKDGLQAGKVKVSSEEINAGGNRIQGVADGKEKDDAATVGQLQKIAGSAGQAINELGNHLNRMDTRINRVGAGAAALAALHPVETDGRWSLSAGFGSYRNANSLAFGTFYRASDNVLFNMGATVGNGENMINAGFSIALDRNPAVTGMTKAAMAREIRTLKQDNQAKDAQVKDLQNQVDALKKENDDTKAKLALIMAKLGM